MQPYFYIQYLTNAHLRYNRKGKPMRYKNLLQIIKKNKCKSILEIGVYRGQRAQEMIGASLINNKACDIHYYGFDLFEELTEEEMQREFSKQPYTTDMISSILKKTGVNIDIRKGHTDESLPSFVKNMDEDDKKIDFAFIDGGHAFETIDNDWKYVEKILAPNGIVVFDDYYKDDDYMNSRKAGCQHLIDNLDRKKFKIEILTPADTFQKKWGPLTIHFAKVTRL